MSSITYMYNGRQMPCEPDNIVWRMQSSVVGNQYFSREICNGKNLK